MSGGGGGGGGGGGVLVWAALLSVCIDSGKRTQKWRLFTQQSNHPFISDSLVDPLHHYSQTQLC